MNINAKKILFMLRQAPHGTTQAQEALDILLMANSFAHEINVIFLSEGIFALLKQQDTTLLGIKNFTSAYKALPLYDVNNLYIAQQDLIKYQLNLAELLLTPKLLTDIEIKSLMDQQDIIFNF